MTVRPNIKKENNASIKYETKFDTEGNETNFIYMKGVQSTIRTVTLYYKNKKEKYNHGTGGSGGGGASRSLS